SALVFAERIADVALVAASGSLDDLQPFLNQTKRDHVRGDLILDSGPNLVRVNERQRRLVASRPGAKQQTRLVAESVSRPLQAGMLEQVCLEVVTEDRLKVAANVGLVDRSVHTVDLRHPGADDPVRDAADAVLILRPL